MTSTSIKKTIAEKETSDTDKCMGSDVTLHNITLYQVIFEQRSEGNERLSMRIPGEEPLREGEQHEWGNLHLCQEQLGG